MSSIVSLFHHLNIMRKARKHGSIFPAIGQVVRSAPNGTSSAPTKGSWWQRLREETLWFRHTQHHIQLSHWPSLHILHLSDLHLRTCDDFLKSTLRTRGINSRSHCDGRYHHQRMGRYCGRTIPSILPMCQIAILGNWEYWVADDLTEWRNLLKSIRCSYWSMNGPIPTTDEMTIVGTDDHLAGTNNPRTLCKSTSRPTLCLTHSHTFQ